MADLVEYMKNNKARRTKKLEDKKTANKARNKTNSLVKDAKNTFIKDELRDFQNNPKNFWEQIKSTYSSDKFNNLIQFSDNEGNLLNNSQTAHLINDYFTNIGPNLAKAAQEMADARHNIPYPQLINIGMDPNQPNFKIQYLPTKS